MLLGHKVVVRADHLDLLNVNDNSPDRVQRWWLTLEEHWAQLKNVKGNENIVPMLLVERKLTKYPGKNFNNEKR